MKTNVNLHIHDLELGSFANGPGRRAVVWFQGCTLACPGCFNPQTHSSTQGTSIHPAHLAAQILAHAAELAGVTISGGEPLQQPFGLLHFLQLIRANSDLSIVLFSGFTWEEIQKMPFSAQLPELVDVLIAGRYQEQLNVGRGLVGSANKTFHYFTNRYRRQDFEKIPEAEITIGADGEIFVSGIAPLVFY